MSACLKPGVSSFLYLASPTNRGSVPPPGRDVHQERSGFHVDGSAFVQFEACLVLSSVPGEV